MFVDYVNLLLLVFIVMN